MVQYLASSATTTITVILAEVGTTLTISAPAEVIQGEPFIIEGQLKRADTGVPLSGETISLSFNGVSLGTTTTRDVEGVIKYLTTVQIDTVGSFTLTANFAGSTRPGLALRPSQIIRNVGIGAKAIDPIVMVAGAAVLAISLVVLATRK